MREAMLRRKLRSVSQGFDILLLTKVGKIYRYIASILGRTSGAVQWALKTFTIKNNQDKNKSVKEDDKNIVWKSVTGY